jgi:transcriptional regulator with XRE-family HTH domain
MDKKINEKIRLLRLEKNYSQEYVAAQLELSQSYYGRIENGKRTISVDCLMKILSVFDVDYNTFFNDINNGQSSQK